MYIRRTLTKENGMAEVFCECPVCGVVRFPPLFLHVLVGNGYSAILRCGTCLNYFAVRVERKKEGREDTWCFLDEHSFKDGLHLIVKCMESRFQEGALLGWMEAQENGGTIIAHSSPEHTKKINQSLLARLMEQFLASEDQQ